MLAEMQSNEITDVCYVQSTYVLGLVAVRRLQAMNIAYAYGTARFDVAAFKIFLHSLHHNMLISLLIYLQLRLVDFDTGGGMDLPARQVAEFGRPHLSSS
jgi:hypothetical protein